MPMIPDALLEFELPEIPEVPPIPELPELPLAVGIDVVQQHVDLLERRAGLAGHGRQIAGANVDADVLDLGKHAADPIAELGRPCRRQDREGTTTGHIALQTKERWDTPGRASRRSRC